jgi:hypothetical protein
VQLAMTMIVRLVSNSSASIWLTSSAEPSDGDTR